MDYFKKRIRNIPDFPKKGIMFRDITTLLGDAKAYKKTIDIFYRRFKDKNITAVIGIESRGFIFGSTLAYKLGAKFVPVRKKGKLPFKTVSASYALEYGQDTLEMHTDALTKKDNVLITDDLLATGGTAKAVVDLVNQFGARIKGLVFVIELSFLKGRGKLRGLDVSSIVDYDSE